MTLHKEIEFENDICAHLLAHGWLYAEGDHAAFHRALFPTDVVAWVQGPQPLPLFCPKQPVFKYQL